MQLMTIYSAFKQRVTYLERRTAEAFSTVVIKEGRLRPSLLGFRFKPIAGVRRLPPLRVRHIRR